MPDLESAGSEPKRPPAVVTLAALYGTGGVVIGPQVAQQLDVAFLDRAIPASVAAQTGVPEEVVAAADERPLSRGQRLLTTLARAPSLTAGPAQERWFLDESAMRSEIRRFMADAARSGGVVLGRAGAIVLREVPQALHVYLGGPLQARIARVMEAEGVDRATAERRVKANDWARREYVRRAYGADGDDPALYHLMIDATAFPVDACVELIVAAATLHTPRTTDATR
ncbi:cytidylate kinase [Streptomyces sp. A244]|uniref:cytidylate kinase-like family protein n=1 Tax=Streptomyces sp. A244 TaxID=2137016 RepID=UPI000D19CA34|nr:cytidylate kinase-like family protein [Streptomyces sp. A244]PTH83605.1 cytidylate kinase [Streptomyces sp. A244]